MCNVEIAFVSRAPRYSPNSVEKDAAILRAVSVELCKQGYTVHPLVCETELAQAKSADIYVSMARSEQALALLDERAAQGTVIVNRPRGIRMCCQRALQMQLLERAGVPVAPLTGDDGYWVKRGDGSAETPADVVYTRSWSEAVGQRELMLTRGIEAVDMRAHVKGDLVKFYGVSQTGFFRYYYPGDDQETKFGDEAVNGRPAHYSFSESALHDAASQAAALTGVDVYGGDCIVRSDGTLAIIDFNDWPSFSRCRAEAAKAIAECVRRRIDERKL